MNPNDELTVPIDEVITETAKAYLVRLCWIDDNFKIWMPKSYCSVDCDESELYAPRWLIKSKAEEFESWDLHELAES